MKRKVPVFWTFVFGVFWTFYCAQAIAVLQGPASAAIPISIDTGVRSTEFQQIPQVHAPYDPCLHAHSTAGILPLEEFAGTTSEEETDQEKKAGQASTHRTYRFLTLTSAGQVRSAQRRRCEPGIPLYLLLGNLRIHDCSEA